VRFGYEIIEVATFRAAHTPIDEDNSVDEGGIACSTSAAASCATTLYGTIEEDVWRRDFTANALYYNIEDFLGVGLRRRRRRTRAQAVLRMIGDPETRYREDPVRMLRAVRFAAKLGFTIHADTAAPIPKLAWMLDGVPPARLFDEVNKIFSRAARRPRSSCSNAAACWSTVSGSRERVAGRAAGSARELVRLGLQARRRVREEKVGHSRLSCFAILMWPAMQRRISQAGARQRRRSAAALDSLRSGDSAHSRLVCAIPKRFTLAVRELVGLQPRFERREGRRALRLLNHPRFRAAYDFLVLRAAAGEVDAELAKWWTDIQAALADERIARVER
jgi:poly(A) polymerase